MSTSATGTAAVGVVESVVEVTVLDEDESVQTSATATHAASTRGQQTRNSVLGTLEDGTSPTSLKFRNNLLGGLHDGSLERVVAEAEALEEQ